MKNVLTVPSIVAGSKSGGGAGETTNYDDLTNKPKVNGIILSGNKTSADLGITTLTPFSSTWPTTGKFEDLLAAIRADATAVKGASFLGEVTFDDLPANLGNAEIKVEILEGTTPATKVIHSVITSGNRKPYRWEYTSWNSGNSNSGWISFQLPLTAGDGISIENNVISATGGVDVPEDVYTQRNLLAGKGIEIVDEPVEGGIDEHTMGCWHFDGDYKNAIEGREDINFGNFQANINSTYFKFGTGSHLANNSALASFGVVEKVVYKDYTVDFWGRLTSSSSRVGVGCSMSSSSLYGRGFECFSNELRVMNSSSSSNDATTIKVTLDTPLLLNTWHHFACTYNDNTKEMAVFINGKELWRGVNTSTSTTGVGVYAWSSAYIDEVRVSDIVRPLDEDGKFPVPTKPYFLAVPTGNKVVNNTITKTSQLTNDSGFITSVNSKTGNVILTGADIQTTYTYNSEETTTTVNAFANAVFHDINNVTALIPTKAVTSDNVTKIVKFTQEEYNALETKDQNTLYYIVG